MKPVIVLGIFAADTTYRAARLPKPGETILGEGFTLGPGGKGSNQAVACARAGAQTHFITRLGRDAFGEMAQRLWEDVGVFNRATMASEGATGASFIFVDHESGDNAIIVCPGVGATISPEDVEAEADVIRNASVFLTQLEQPLDAALRGLQIARDAGVITVLNPAPAAPLDDAMLALVDFLTPNETEAEALTGLPVTSLTEAEAAGHALLARGAGTVVLTLSAGGALHVDRNGATHIPAFNAGPVAETTGAGDAFNGALAAALGSGMTGMEAARFGCAAGAIAVTRPGAAQSMPTRREIEALLARA